jgi:hypothetical protein
MKTFEIEIQAIVRKTITVTAKDQDEAVITAHEQFNVMNDDVPEEYEQDTVNIKEIKRSNSMTLEVECLVWSVTSTPKHDATFIRRMRELRQYSNAQTNHLLVHGSKQEEVTA